ncbi:hypothetical protein [Schleiferilactobacillus harbinensis]|uniref:Uncharacterized protein n=1 Tax=Schleiferilactobacillus harbinensis TaxID=304207 RepID=A0ABU7T286_9LACO
MGQTLTGSDARQWLARLAALHLPDWADRYTPEPGQVVPAGTQWTLTLNQDDGAQHVMTGDSVYPQNWSALVDLLRQAALAPNGHLQPPVRWQFDFVRFADLHLPQFQGAGDILSRSTIYQETILIDAAQQTLYVATRYPDPQPYGNLPKCQSGHSADPGSGGCPGAFGQSVDDAVGYHRGPGHGVRYYPHLSGKRADRGSDRRR